MCKVICQPYQGSSQGPTNPTIAVAPLAGWLGRYHMDPPGVNPHMNGSVKSSNDREEPAIGYK